MDVESSKTLFVVGMVECMSMRGAAMVFVIVIMSNKLLNDLRCR